MSPTLDCYNEILPSFSCVPDEEGMIDFLSATGVKKPATIGGATLVLPTQARLRKGFPEELFPFSPLSESMSRQGTSPVIQYLQRAAKANISHVVVVMAQSLLEIAVDKTTHKDLPPDCLDFLVKLADVDKEKNIKEVFEKVIAAAVKKNRLTTVYLKNGGTFDGVKVNRSCIIRIPLLEDLKQEGKDVLGVTVTKKQRKILTALFKLIVPFGDNPEEYSHGTTSRHAPYFQCLLVAYAKMIKVLNQCVNSYAAPLQLPIKPIPTYDPAIVDTFEKLRAESDIPPMRGNEGGTHDTDVEASQTVSNEAAIKANNVQKPVVAQNTRNAPAPAATTAAKPGTISMADFMAANNPQPGLVNVNFNGNQQSNLNGSFGNMNGNNSFGNNTGFSGSNGNNGSLFGNPAPTAQPAGFPWQQQHQQPSTSLFGNAPINNPPFNNGIRPQQGGLGLI